MKKTAIFYHCLFKIGDEILLSALDIIQEQMEALKHTGLLDAATEFHVGVNGGNESWIYAKQIIPKKAQITFHGLECRNENKTIEMMWEWSKTHPDWNCLYFHSKGATHVMGSDYEKGMATPWRNGMMLDLVHNWKQCVKDLESGYDIACSHWMWNLADGSQHIPAGNFLWVASNFVATLPSFHLRERIKDDGIAALSSRYEAEVFWGNGTRPNVISYRPNGGNGVP